MQSTFSSWKQVRVRTVCVNYAIVLLSLRIWSVVLVGLAYSVSSPFLMSIKFPAPWTLSIAIIKIKVGAWRATLIIDRRSARPCSICHGNCRRESRYSLPQMFSPFLVHAIPSDGTNSLPFTRCVKYLPLVAAFHP